MYRTPALTQQIRRRRNSAQRLHTPKTFAAARALRFSSNDANAASTPDLDTPWGTPDIPKLTTVFKTSPTFGSPPLGGTSEAALHWKTCVDLHLRSSRFVRDIIDGRRSHPWADHPRLQALGSEHTDNYTFKPSTTASTLEWVAVRDPACTTL